MATRIFRIITLTLGLFFVHSLYMIIFQIRKRWSVAHTIIAYAVGLVALWRTASLLDGDAGRWTERAFGAAITIFALFAWGQLKHWYSMRRHRRVIHRRAA